MLLFLAFFVVPIIASFSDPVDFRAMWSILARRSLVMVLSALVQALYFRRVSIPALLLCLPGLACYLIRLHVTQGQETVANVSKHPELMLATVIHTSWALVVIALHWNLSKVAAAATFLRRTATRS